MNIRLSFLLLFLFLPAGLAPTDLSRLKEVGDARFSPDGTRIVYVVGETASDRTRVNTRLWTMPVNGGEAKRLTTGEANESTPRWSPDGKWIAFYSNRDGKDSIWIAPAGGGEPKLVTRVRRTNFYLNHAGESFAWAPDSRRIAFLSSPEVLSESRLPTTARDPKLTGVAGIPEQVLRPLTREEIETKLPPDVREMILRAQGQALGRKATTPIEQALSALPDDPRVITRLQYKSRTAFSDTLQSHIFTADIETGELRQVTTGFYYEHSIDWSPAGDEIAFVSNREPDPDRINNTDLFAVNVKTFAIRQLTKTKGCEWQPAYSPDGSRIAYLATGREITTIDSVAEDTQAYVIAAQGGEPRNLSQEKDRRVSAVKWSSDSQTVYFQLSDRGKGTIWSRAASKPGPLAQVLDRPAQLGGFAVSGKGSLALLLSEPDRPVELYLTTIGANGKASPDLKPLTNLHAALREQAKFVAYREFSVENEGLEIQGWAAIPAEASATNKAPVILLIHGGPHGMHGYGFNPTVQSLVGYGYAVLMINPRGSTGYGQKFADGCLNDWGGGDYRDLMKGVDAALARFPALDGDRLGVMGGSYGGYMTNWIVTQTGRFKAAVTIASISNLISFYATSLYQDLIHAEFNGYPWEKYDLLWERSPLKHIGQAKTPTLLIHGEQDHDVHITQAEEMYTSLRMRGIDAVFVRYPREGHGIREPRHREDLLARQIQWFDRYLKKK